MKKLGGAAGFLALVTVSAVLTGCGQPWDPERRGEESAVAPVVPAPSNPEAMRPVPVPQVAGAPEALPSPVPVPPLPVLEETGAEKLGMYLAGPAEDPEFPCRPGAAKCAAMQATAQYTRDEISIRETLPFQNQWFFVWSEGAFRSPIRDAYFEHRVQNPSNVFKGTPDRVPVSFDPETRRWFVPAAKLGRPTDHNPSIQQWLKLDLSLADGRRLEYTVRFRAVGALPTFAPNPIAVPQPSSPAEFVTAYSHWVLRSELIQNPVARPLRLWARFTGSDLRTGVALRFNRFHDQPNNPPTGPHPEYYSVNGTIIPGVLVIHRAGGPEHRALAQNEWVQVELGASERIRLEWVALPTPGLTRCTRPERGSRVASWTRRTPRVCVNVFQCFGGEEQRFSQQVEETWEFGGASIDGSWSRELRISNPLVELGEMTGGQSAPVATDSVTVSANAGSTSSGAPPFSCQGYF